MNGSRCFGNIGFASSFALALYTIFVATWARNRLRSGCSGFGTSLGLRFCSDFPGPSLFLPPDQNDGNTKRKQHLSAHRPTLKHCGHHNHAQEEVQDEKECNSEKLEY
jgi:hypothetical protein